MARPLRIQYAGAVYHVTSRGNEKKIIFKDDEDRKNFLNVIRHTNKRYNWICHAYCLMNNHYHLLIETPEGNLSTGMRQLNGVYTQLFNMRHNRCGHLFQGRYKAILIQKDAHLLEVCRYVVLNPVRAHVVESPDLWKWNSYRATSGKEKAHPCLTIAWVLSQFNTKKATAESEYRQFVKGGIGQKDLWTNVKGQTVLGSAEFVDKLISHFKKRERVVEIPRNQRYLNRPSIENLFKGKAENVSERNKQIFTAIENGYSQKQIADHLGIHYSTISRLVKIGSGLES